jgi:hypothetical protein
MPRWATGAGTGGLGSDTAQAMPRWATGAGTGGLGPDTAQAMPRWATGAGTGGLGSDTAQAGRRGLAMVAIVERPSEPNVLLGHDVVSRKGRLHCTPNHLMLIGHLTGRVRTARAVQDLPACKLGAQALDSLAMGLPSSSVFPHVWAFAGSACAAAEAEVRTAGLTALAVITEGGWGGGGRGGGGGYAASNRCCGSGCVQRAPH